MGPSSQQLPKTATTTHKVIMANCKSDLANSRTTHWNNHLDTLAMQSKFKDIVALDSQCKVWNSLCWPPFRSTIAYAKSMCRPPSNFHVGSMSQIPSASSAPHNYNNLPCSKQLSDGPTAEGYTRGHDSVLYQIIAGIKRGKFCMRILLIFWLPPLLL